MAVILPLPDLQCFFYGHHNLVYLNITCGPLGCTMSLHPPRSLSMPPGSLLSHICFYFWLGFLARVQSGLLPVAFVPVFMW